MARELEIRKEFVFEAAHYFGHKPDGHPYKRLHGHSYWAEIALAGTPDDRGWVEDFADVDAALSEVKGELDHRLLNEIEGLEAPSLEIIAMWIAERLSQRFPTLKSVSVRRPSCGESCVYTLR